MVKFRNLEVGILQNDVAATEYEDPETTPTKDSITRYIEIKEDQSFVIRVARDPDYDIQPDERPWIEVTIDGQYAGHMGLPGYHARSDPEEDFDIITGLPIKINGREVFWEFQFEEANLRSIGTEETIDELREQYKDQGKICVEMSLRAELPSTDEDSSEDESDDPNDEDFLPNEEIPNDGETPLEPEDSFQLAAPRDIVKESGSTSKASLNIVKGHVSDMVTSDPGEKRLVANYCFKYRTIEALYDQQIVPRPEKDISTLRADYEALQRENDELRARIKTEAAETLVIPLGRKRRILLEAESGEVELIEERPVQRRKPNADDVVVVLDD